MENDDIKNLLASANDEALAMAARRQMRSWNRLQSALFGPLSEQPAEEGAHGSSFFVNVGAFAAIAIALGFAFFVPASHSNGPSQAQARQPDVYTATFYSTQAQADVVWITGLQSADETSNTP